MRQKLSYDLFDAYLNKDTETINSIKSIIEARNSAIRAEYEKPTIDIPVSENIIAAPGNPPSVGIYEYLNSKLGAEWWDLEIETLFDMLERSDIVKSHEEIPRQMRDKILGVRHLCNSDLSFRDWFQFNQTALAISGSSVDFTMLRFPSPGAILSALITMFYIRPDANGDLSEEVKTYISVVLKNNGIYAPPPSMFAYIGNTMRGILSQETLDMWLGIYDAYKNGDFDSETPESIQANRMRVVEESARAYYYNDTTQHK